MSQASPSFWNLPEEQVLQQIESNSQGLSRQEAQKRLIQYGAKDRKSVV